MGIAYTLGRVFIPILFVVMGIQNAMNIGELAKMLTANNIIVPDDIAPYLWNIPKQEALSYLFVAIEIICGLMVLIGLKARWAALVLIVYAACTIIFVHHFWDMEGATLIENRTEALKDLSIIGGLLLIVAVGSAPSTIDHR
jgi:putative oxidoreductase